MGGTPEAFARLATTGPHPFEPIEPAPVEHDRPLRTLACGGRIPMPGHQDGEARERRQHPWGRRHTVADAEPAEHRCRDRTGEPQTAGAFLATYQARDRLAARRQASRVLGVRVAHGGPG
jgi:hypothetical protein